MTGLSPFGNGRDERRHSARQAPVMPADWPGGLRAGVILCPAIAVGCLLAAIAVLLGDEPPGTVKAVLAMVTLGVLTMAVISYRAAQAAGRQVDERVRAARLVVHRGQAELRQMVDRLMRGEQPAPLVPAPARTSGGDEFLLLTAELEQSQYQAGQAMLQVADKVFGGRSDQRVEIFVNLARRMQSLLHKEIELLDELEDKVADPDLLKALFAVDHLATRLRRQSESLAVLGGSDSGRQWTRQVPVHEVLRAGVAEVEHYSQVKVVPPVEGALHGTAVTDVIHLVAEVVENATRFSAPQATVLLRTQQVPAGVAIEIEDRGPGMEPADQRRMNDLLADPDRVDVDEMLRDGRIGLYVTAMLARRHGIRVRLENNIYGGTLATAVLPRSLLAEPGPWRAAAEDGADDESATADGGPRLALVPAGGGPPAKSDDPGGPASVSAQRPPLPRRSAQAAKSPRPDDRRRDELSDDASR